MPFTFTVNNVNMLPFIQEDGLKWTRFDVESPDTGRTLDGRMHRGRVAVKIRLDVTCRPLTSAEAATVPSSRPLPCKAKAAHLWTALPMRLQGHLPPCSRRMMNLL